VRGGEGWVWVWMCERDGVGWDGGRRLGSFCQIAFIIQAFRMEEDL